ncbi:hypothetical protein [Actinosynnema sp. NPDC020468]|uniref:hypothetical protein n=1 Tax=Actinosynnema sp. NPDC020468 TaxID=3154488 RepID=UPI00340E9096
MADRPGLDVLRRLHVALGEPSFRKVSASAQLRGHVGRNGNGFGASTFSDLLTGKTEPTRRTVAAFVVGCLDAGTPVEGLAEAKLHPQYWHREFAAAIGSAAVAPPPADPARFADQPSRLLVAENEVVAFTGRAAELDELTAWRDGTAPLSALWLHGPGGQGKTRLGRRFAADSAAAGWRAQATWAAPDGPDDGRQDLLSVVDYADRVPHTDLVALIDRHVGDRRRVRILLLARATSPWPAVRFELAARQGTADDLALTALADSAADRARMFTAARDSFARALGVADPAAIAPPTDLDHPDLGLALSLHMAALVAVDAHVRQVTPPATPTDLSTYLLDREEAHWLRLLQRPDFRAAPHAMREAVFAACLIGAQSFPEAVRALSFAQDPRGLVMDHAYCYPGTDPELVLQPLLPDRLAEDFLALMLPGGPEQRAEQWALPSLRALLARSADGTPPTGVDRAVTFLAAASAPGRRPHVVAHLEALLRADPKLALDAGGAALSALTHLDPEVLAGIVGDFPLRDADLDVGMYDVIEAASSVVLGGAGSPAERAEVFAQLSLRARFAGELDRAVELGKEAIRLYRTLPAGVVDPIDMAVTLNAIAELLGMLGSLAESAALAQESLDVLGEAAADLERAADRPVAFEAYATGPLVTLGSAALMSGEEERARELFERAVEFAPSADEQFDTGGYALATALMVLGNALMAADLYADAHPVLRRAVEAFDRARVTYPKEFEAERSAALDLLGWCLNEIGQREEGDRYQQEALAVARRQADSNPTAHDDRYLSALVFDADAQADAGAFDVAEDLLRRAVEIADAQRERGYPLYRPNMVRCLTALANVLDRADEWERVWPVLDRASEIAVHTPQGIDRMLFDALSGELRDLAKRLERAGRPAERVVVAVRMVEVARSVTDLGGQLADALEVLGWAYLEAGRPSDAVTAAREEVAIRDEAAAGTGDHAPAARARTVLALSLSATQAPPAEIIDVLVAAVEHHPGRELPDDRMQFVGMLIMLPSLFGQSGRFEEAVDWVTRWLDFVDEAAREDPAYTDQGVMLRAHRAISLCVTDRVPEGVAQADEVRGLAAEHEVGVLARAGALHAYALSRYVSEDDVEDALVANEESLSLLAGALPSEPALQTDIDAARQVRLGLLDLAGRGDEAARLRAEIEGA